MEEATVQRTVGDIKHQDVLPILDAEQQALSQRVMSPNYPQVNPKEHFQTFEDAIIGDHYWIFFLYAETLTEYRPLVGFLGVEARHAIPELTLEEQELEKEQLHLLIDRAAKLLADAQLQGQMFEILDAMLNEMDTLRLTGPVDKFGQIHDVPRSEPADFAEWVHGALKDLWGGPKLADSKLLELRVVQEESLKNGSSPTRALQSILTTLIENLKPDGERNLESMEWVFYNILNMRFVQGKKAGDVASEVAMSPANFYRKQKAAIEELAAQLWELEQNHNGVEVDPDARLTN
jgi:hypothetical protein